MNKPFDTVKFQRERRKAMSAKLAKKSAKEIVKYFETNLPPIKRRRRSRATAHNSGNNGARK